MSVLDKKLLRDLAGLRGQVITIALVVACGITSYITLRSAYDSLLISRDEYYTEYYFADVFARLKRAPRSVANQLAAIDGVERVQTRVVEQVLVPMRQMTRPASGTIVSLDPRQRRFRLNDVYIKQGRGLEPGRHDEVLVIEGFALAHGLRPGDRLPVVINGTLRRLRIVGVALSPEYVMTLAPGQLSYDPAQTPVLWMNEEALAAAFRMEGAFNDVALTLQRSAAEREVLTQVDEILKRYGGFGAVGRDKQISNYMLQGELSQLDNMAGFVPYLFLFVAALLVNVVLSRLIQLQRGVIATLKAVGYRDLNIGLHYLKLVSVILFAGAVLGVGLGAWLGREMMALYTDEYFRFPNPRYRLGLDAVGFSVGISVAAAVAGAWLSVRQVVGLPPAEAMRPVAPARYRRSLLERVRLWNWLGPSFKMIWREASRRPLRLLLSALGISLAVAILVVGRSMWDSVTYLMDVQFHRSMREDLNVTLLNAKSTRGLSTLRHIPGVHYAEGLRTVPVRFRAGHRHRDASIIGYPADVRLRHLLDADARRHSIPERGLLLTTKLGELLDLQVGDQVTVELREGNWETREVPVVGFVDEPFGLAGHMNQRALSRLLRDGGAINTVLLEVDTDRLAAVEAELKQMPAIASVFSPLDFRRQFDEQSAAIIGVFTFIMTLFASVIAVGVIYNNARVALSQRNRDLASLRVLGFTRREIATLLFGEQAIQVLLALPLGLFLGHALARAMMANADPENYRLPVQVSSQTYVFAIAVTVISAAFSGWLLRRKLSKLDLIGVLKTRE